MENPRPEKVAVVDEVRARLESADAVLLTEYRGLKVSELSELRASMRAAGGDYRIYKNTLVRRAAQSLNLDLDSALTGPTALAFVSAKADGSPGDIATVAKAITTFAKGNPLLVLKAGVLGDNVLDAAGATALASLPTASEIYARLAGALNNGARGLAGVVNGINRSIALVLQAAIDAGAFAGPAPEPESAAPEAEAPEAEATTPEAEVTEPVAEAEAEPAADAAETVDEVAAVADAEATPETETETESNESTEEN